MSRWAKLAAEVREEIKHPAPPPAPRRKKHTKQVNRFRQSVMVRWESVREEQKEWLEPFYKLPIERAMAYLEDLRKICERAGYIMNQRIGNDPKELRCAGPRCGKDLSGLKPNGFPKWIANWSIKDKMHPEITHRVVFCSELCANTWVRATNGAGGTTGQ